VQVSARRLQGRKQTKCGNFLFYRKDDAEVRDAATWADLERRHESIFVDFFGHLTLGEWYITMLAEKSGLEGAQAAVLGSRAPAYRA